MEQKKLCAGDKITLLRCGANAKIRNATVLYSSDLLNEFIPGVRPLGFLPLMPVPGTWRIIDEDVTWTRL